MNRKWKIGLIVGGIVVLLAVAAGICFWLFGQRNTDTPPDDSTVNKPIDLPESEYNIDCVLTESAIRYTEVGDSYEIDVFSLNQNKTMTLVIDESGIMPLEGRIYRAYLSKADPNKGVFAVPVTSGGIAKMDLSRVAIATRSADWLYTGSMSVKYRMTEESVVYYMQIMDGFLRRVEADSVESLAQFNKQCPDHEKHVHTNSCYFYNAYLKYTGGFLDPYKVTWAAFTVDGASMYYYMGTEEDTLHAILPGQESTTSKLAVTTSDRRADGTIDVKDFTGKTYTCRINGEGVQPVGGRFYRIDEESDGTVRFSVPKRKDNTYDYYPAPLTAVDGDNVTFLTTTTKKRTDKTQLLRASRSWTGWMTLESVDASEITVARTTSECKKKEAHTHTKECYFYNAFYRTDGYNGLDWVVTEKTGISLFSAVGGEADVAWGSCDPANTAVVLSVDGKTATLMDMNGAEHICTFQTTDKLPVYAGGLYHVEWENSQTAKISEVKTNLTTPGFDCTKQPLRAIDGNKLTFSQGDNEKVTYLTSSTKIFYMAAGDNRLIPMSAGELQTAKRTDTCINKEEHEHTNGCFYMNTIFACDGLGNLKWVICSAKNGSVNAAYGNQKNLVKEYAPGLQTCLTLTGVNEKGRIEIQRMNGTRTSYTVHPSGLTPVKGRVYACEWKDNMLLFSNPNLDEIKNFSRSGIVEIEDGYITNSQRQTFRLTENTLIYSVDVKDGKLVLWDDKKLTTAVPTNFCKGQPEGHDHLWGKCYSGNFIYATDGAGTLLWIVARADGNGISGYVGHPDKVTAQAGAASQVLFTTSAIFFKDNAMWIKGIDMTGATVEGALTSDSILPVKGSIYHMEKVDGKLCLSAPDTAFRQNGYDLGCRPLYKYADNTIQLVTKEKYSVTSNTRIFNVETVGGILVLKEGKELPIAQCTCKKTHTHVNDCYRYNMYFAANSSDELLWVLTAPADTSLFYKTGLSATDTVDSDDPAAVAVTVSHTYPVWVNGVKEYRVDLIDMTGASYSAKVDESGIIPAQGKGYHIARNEDGSVCFGKPTTYDAPSAGNTGYDFSRYQAMAVNGSYVVLRNGKLLKVNADTKIFSATVSDNRLTLTPDTAITASVAKSGCTGDDHNHVSGCFPYTIWYACDNSGNLKWIISEKSGTNGIYNAQGSDKDSDMKTTSFETAPYVFVTKAPYLSNGQRVVDMQDIFGTVYTAVRLDETSSVRPTTGLPYKVTFKDDAVSFEKFNKSFVSREKGLAYGNGILTGDSKRSFRIGTGTRICYVKKNDDNTLTLLADNDPQIPANGFPENPSGYNILHRADANGYIQWMMVEVSGQALYGIYDWYTETDVVKGENIVLTTGNAYPQWEADGRKVIRVPVTDMTGKEAVLTLDNAEDITVIPGKLYQVTYSEDNSTAALSKCGELIYRGKMSAKDEENGVLTITRSGVTYQLTLSADAFAYQVTSSGKAGHYRLTLEKEGIGPTSGSFNAIYGTDEWGDISFILTTADGVTAYNSIYGAGGNAAGSDTPDVKKPSFETTPVAFVKKEPYASDGQSVIDLQDIFGTVYTAVQYDEGSAVYPKAGLPYKVTFTDGVAKLEKLTSSMVSREKGLSYQDGVLTGDSKRSYKITADTYICYVKKNSDNTLTLLDADDAQIPATGFPENPKGYNVLQSFNMKKTSSGGYVQWMLVEVSGQSMYSIFDWYSAAASTRAMGLMKRNRLLGFIL